MIRFIPKQCDCLKMGGGKELRSRIFDQETKEFHVRTDVDLLVFTKRAVTDCIFHTIPVECCLH